MFEIERVYGQHNNRTGLTEWFFSAREGIYGPFSSKEDAFEELGNFKKFNLENSNDGGRNLNNISKLSLLPLEGCMYKTRQRGYF